MYILSSIRVRSSKTNWYGHLGPVPSCEHIMNLPNDRCVASPTVGRFRRILFRKERKKERRLHRAGQKRKRKKFFFSGYGEISRS